MSGGERAPGPGARRGSSAAVEKPARAERRAFRVFLLVWVLWGALLGAIRFQHPGLEVGEGWSDADILNAGRWFDAAGYGPTRGLPRLDTAPLAPGEKPLTYNSYPPGPFWIHQGIKALGVRRLAWQRVAAQAWTHAGELLFFLLVRRLTGRGWLACLAAGLHMFSLPYAGYSSGFWVNMGQPTLFAAMYPWVRFESATAAARPRGAWWLAACLAVVFVDFWIVLENAPAIAVFAGVRACMTRRRGIVAGAAAVAAVPVVVMALRIGHTAWAEHTSLVAAARHYVDSAGSRSWDNPVGWTARELATVWLSRLGWPWSADANLAHNRLFMFPVLAPVVLASLAVLAALLASRWRDERLAPARRGVGAGTLMLGAGLTWTVLMRNHVWTHQFTVFTLMPGLSVLAGSLAWAGLASVRAGGARAGRCLGPAAALIAVVAMTGWLRTSDTLNHAFRLHKATRVRVKQGEEETARLLRAGQALGRVELITLYPRWPMVSYALGLPAVHRGGPPPEGLPAGPRRPWAIEAWSAAAQGLSLRLASAVGEPDVATESGRLLVFPGRAGRRQEVGAEIEGVGRLVSVRAAPTLDGSAIALVWTIAGPDAPASTGRVSVVAVLTDAAGRQLAEAGPAAVLSAGDRAMGWCVLPRPAWRAAARVRLLVWDPALKRARAWSLPTVLPAGFTAEGEGLDIDLGLWRPMPKAPARRRAA